MAIYGFDENNLRHEVATSADISALQKTDTTLSNQISNISKNLPANTNQEISNLSGRINTTNTNLGNTDATVKKVSDNLVAVKSTADQAYYRASVNYNRKPCRIVQLYYTGHDVSSGDKTGVGLWFQPVGDPKNPTASRARTSVDFTKILPSTDIISKQENIYASISANLYDGAAGGWSSGGQCILGVNIISQKTNKYIFEVIGTPLLAVAQSSSDKCVRSVEVTFTIYDKDAAANNWPQKAPNQDSNARP